MRRLPNRHRGARRFLPRIALLILLGALAGALALTYKATLPPSEIAIAAGPKGGGYYSIAERYQKLLAGHGIKLRIVETSGAEENLALIGGQAAPVQAAIVQGGLGRGHGDAPVASIGRHFYEPLLIFTASGIGRVSRIGQLKGLRLAIGGDGTGTQILVRELLGANGLTEENTAFAALAPQDAQRSLLGGEVDAAFFVMKIDAPIIQLLLKDRSVALASLDRAAIYPRVMPYLRHAVLPAGSVDLVDDLPPGKVDVVATTAAILVRKDLHSAIVYILTEVANQVHNDEALFGRIDPATRSQDPEYEMADAALRFYKHGAPFLHRHFTFWVADFMERSLLIGVPAAALFLPAFGFLSRSWDWMYRRRVWQWYEELIYIDERLSGSMSAIETQSLIDRLDAITADVQSAHPPISYSEKTYRLLEDIDDVRNRCTAKALPAAG